MTLAEQLRALREAAGLTQEGLAKRLAISVSALSKIEAGKRTPLVATMTAWPTACGYRFTPVFTPIADPAPESTIARPVTLADFTNTQLLAEIKRRMERT